MYVCGKADDTSTLYLEFVGGCWHDRDEQPGGGRVKTIVLDTLVYQT